MGVDYLVHPALGVVPLADVEPSIPLVQSDLPAWWNRLDDERQEDLFDQWWRSVSEWLNGHGADTFVLEVLEAADRQIMESTPDIRSHGRGKYSGRWTTRNAEIIGKLLSPQRLEVCANYGLLLGLVESWEGVFVRCPEDECERLRVLLAQSPVRREGD